jgi:tape measure domain-containing protein
MAKKVTVGIRLQADGISPFVGNQKRAQQSLSRTRKSALAAGKGVTTLSASIGRANGLLRTFVGLGVATAFVAAGKAAVASGDQYRILEARIKVATIATGDYNKVSAQLFAISQKNGTSLRETIKLFQNLSRVAPELDANNDQMIRMLDLVQKVGITSGASFDDMKFAMRQFGQSMASGVVRAEEFNSIVENVPELAFQIAKGMDTTVGQLRLAVIEGRVLSTEVFDAINKQGDEINLIFRGFPRSIQQATTALNAGFGKAASKINEELTYGTDEFVDSLDSVAEALAEFAEDDDAVKALIQDLNALANVAKFAGLAFVSFKVGGAVIGGFSALRAQLALVKTELIAINGVTAANSLKSAAVFSPVTSRARSGLSGALGGRVNNNPQGFGVLKSGAQAQSASKLASAMKGLSVASVGALAALGGLPGVLVAGGIAATTYALTMRDSKAETEDFAESLLKMQGDVKGLSLRKLTNQIGEYENKLKSAQKIIDDNSSDNSVITALFGKDLSEIVKAKKDVKDLTELLQLIRSEVMSIETAQSDLASSLGLNADTEYSEDFLAKLTKIKEAQDKVGKSKHELALATVNSLSVSQQEKDRLIDETNQLYLQIAAHDKLTQAKKDAEAVAEKAQAARKAELAQAKAFSATLEQQADSIRHATTALTLEGEALAEHNALMAAGLLGRKDLTAADQARKQAILANTDAYHQQKTAVEQLNAAIDAEIKEDKKTTSNFEGVRTSLLSDEEAENEFHQRQLKQLKAYGKLKVNEHKKVASLIEKETERHQKSLIDIANGGRGIKTLFEEMKASVDGWGRSFAENMVRSSGSFSDFAQNMVEQMQIIALQQATQPLFSAFGDFLGAAFGGLGSPGVTPPSGGGVIHLSGARAAGGPVSGGSSYLVGEKGPEIFTPKQGGNIIPNHKLSQGSGINVSVAVDATGSKVQGDNQEANNIARSIGAVIKAVLVEEMRPGGVLA